MLYFQLRVYYVDGKCMTGEGFMVIMVMVVMVLMVLYPPLAGECVELPTESEVPPKR